MQVNPNVPMRTLYIIALCCLLGFLFSVGVMVWQKVGYRAYAEVPGTITGISTDSSINRSNSSTSVMHYVRFTYEWMGQTRTAEFRTLFKWGKAIGNTVTLRVSPDQPDVVVNPFLTETAICGAAFTLLFGIAMLKAISTRRQTGV